MRIETFEHRAETGWSVARFPALDSDACLVLVFGAASYLATPGPVLELVAAYPRAVVLGCSSAGEIHGTHIADGCLAVAVVQFEHGRLRSAVAEIADGADSERAGGALAGQLDDPSLRAVFVLSDGLLVNGTELCNGLHRVLAPTVVVTGGLAGDGDRFERTWTLAGDAPKDGRIVAVGLYGDRLGVSHGSRGGWDAFGPERLVTRSEGNVLYELDGKPALALYKSYLGERADGLPATALLFPLALRARAETPRLVRTVLSIDEHAQSMIFAGDIPLGCTVQLMRANGDRLIEGAAQASQAASTPDDGPVLTIAVSCVGRRLVLGERAEEEVEAAAEAAPPSGRMIGFYSYGEISPFAPGERSVLHNQTMTLTRIWEH